MFVIVSTCLLYTKICSGRVQQSELCTLAKNLSLLQAFCVYCQCCFYFLFLSLAQKVLLMYSLNLMISLISVPSLASISHCYQINFLKFFFNLFRSFKNHSRIEQKAQHPRVVPALGMRGLPPSVHPTVVPLLQSVHLH